MPIDPFLGSLIVGGLATGAGLLSANDQKRAIEEQKKEQAMTNLINVLAGGGAQSSRAGVAPDSSAVALKGLADTMQLGLAANESKQRSSMDEVKMLDALATNQTKRDYYRGGGREAGGEGIAYWGDALGVDQAKQANAAAQGKVARPASPSNPAEEKLMRLLEEIRLSGNG